MSQELNHRQLKHKNVIKLSKSVGLKRRPALAGDDWLNILPKIPLSKTKLRIKTETYSDWSRAHPKFKTESLTNMSTDWTIAYPSPTAFLLAKTTSDYSTATPCLTNLSLAKMPSDLPIVSSPTTLLLSKTTLIGQ